MWQLFCDTIVVSLEMGGFNYRDQKLELAMLKRSMNGTRKETQQCTAEVLAFIPVLLLDAQKLNPVT